jgi:DNA invertase Pin-like site-specific DNA recombinase
MKIGYARVSTEDQNLDRQIDKLKELGCEKIYKEKITGTKKERPELQKMLENLREGDEVIVTELTRLSRSTKDLIDMSEKLIKMKVELKSVKENIDTTTAAGQCMFSMIAVFSQFERDLISERTKEGLKSARARGKNGGRPVAKQKDIDVAISLYNDKTKKYSINEICKAAGIGKTTFFKYLKENK